MIEIISHTHASELISLSGATWNRMRAKTTARSVTCIGSLKVQTITTLSRPFFKYFGARKSRRYRNNDTPFFVNDKGLLSFQLEARVTWGRPLA